MSNGSRTERSTKAKRLVFMAFRRGGSSIAFEALQILFADSGLRSQDVVAEHHWTGEPISAETYEAALAQNELVGCFRDPPPMDADISGYDIHYVLLVRDPRDCDISWYYARDLHSSDGPAFDSMNQFLLETDDRVQYQNLVDFALSVGAITVRYEDISVDPASFLSESIAPIGFPIIQDAMDIAIMKLTFFRNIISNNSHNRSGLPYQALRTLDDDIIQVLNNRHLLILKLFSYPLKRGAVTEAAQTVRIEIDATKRVINKLLWENSVRIEHINILDKKIADLERKFFAMSEFYTSLMTCNKNAAD